MSTAAPVVTAPEAAELAAEYEQRQAWMSAARMWLSAASIYALKADHAQAEHAARQAAVASERWADEQGRKVPAANQRGGEA